MADIRASATTASTAVFVVMASAALGTQAIRLPESHGNHALQLTVDTVGSDPRPVIDTPADPHLTDAYADFTDADVAMLRHAISAGADETDFSEFYIEDE